MIRPYTLLAAALAVSGAASQAAEMPIEAPERGGVLRGTLTAPEPGGGQAVLIIPGSGLLDRDGNSPAGIRTNTYRLLAEGLAGRGIAAARIDKRGMFASAGAVPDANQVTVGDYVADTRAWVGAIRRETGARCVWLAGHSEGGLVALAAAEDKLPDLCGLVLITTPGMPVGQLLREQLGADPANAALYAQAAPVIAELEAGRLVDVSSLPPVLQMTFRPNVQGFLIDLFSRDPAKMIAGARGPVLILQGRRDVQVGVAQAERLKQAAPGAELLLLADTGHMLKVVRSDDPRESYATYTDPGLELAPGVVDGIADFIARNGAAR